MLVNKVGCVLVFASAALVAVASPANAQHTVNVTVGHFFIPRLDRVETDILLIEHHDLAFDISDFSGTAVGGEWLIPIGHFLEAGAGLSIVPRSVSTHHVRAVNRDGSAIPRALHMRQVPMAFTVRVLPLGQSYRIQPYAGVGIAWIHWRFTESGDFAAPNGTVFRGEAHAATGKAVGPVMMFGLRVAGEALAFGFESRFQSARGSFGPVFARVVEPDLDLDGWTLQVTAGMRFGG